MNAKKAEVSKVWQQQGVGTRVYHTDSKQILYQSFSHFIEHLVCLSANFMTQFFNLKNIQNQYNKILWLSRTTKDKILAQKAYLYMTVPTCLYNQPFRILLDQQFQFNDTQKEQSEEIVQSQGEENAEKENKDIY